jgi:hypothetical protein
MGQQLTGGRERGRMARAAQPVDPVRRTQPAALVRANSRNCLGLAVGAGHETRSATRVRRDASPRRRQRLNSPRRPASYRPWGPFRRSTPSTPQRATPPQSREPTPNQLKGSHRRRNCSVTPGLLIGAAGTRPPHSAVGVHSKFQRRGSCCDPVARQTASEFSAPPQR